MMQSRSLRCFATLAAGLWLSVGAAPAWAVSTLTSVRAVPDITIVLGGTTVRPQTVAVDDLMGGLTTLDVGTVPADARITAFALLPGGDQLLAFDVPVTFGNLTTWPGDVVRRSGTTVSLAFEAAPHGVTPRVGTDAVTIIEGDLALSFDTTVMLPAAGGTITADDEDLVRLTGTTFELVFDGSAAGIASSLDLDAAQWLDNGHLLLSFDGSGMVGGVGFDDEDVLEFDPATMGWELAYDGSSASAEWVPADLTSVFASVAASSTPTVTVTQTATQTPSVSSPTATPTVTTPPTATAPPVASASATVPPATATATSLITPTTAPTATQMSSRTPSPTPTRTATAIAAVCSGDCNDSGEVTIDELVKIVNIALEVTSLDSCPSADADNNGSVAINEIVGAVLQALGECP